MTAGLRAIGQPADHTLVELTWREKRIEHRIRFGRIVDEHRLDRHRRIVSFAPCSVFAFVRWAANEYGTIISRIDIVRSVGVGEPYQTLPFVRPGGEILLRISGWPKVERVLAAVDAIESLGIDAADVAPEHWRHLNHRISVNEPFRVYSTEQHRAWLRRREVLR
ncbi:MULTISPECIES: DUF2840 domain-containing protein [unclassified Nitrobacter]|uniref:DUF2840 domain-containing protein n=1 Tax=unclassified Nitrobacter TaxID=2620411 RepID=UPI000926A389|nr:MULTISPECIES: DUF2840 domain-containing protein [unclassified Nitrobacter]MBN9147080.1 DUF2840 domain-containing protein [Nitrobacter sp.]OJV02410.1 MAG: glycosidase [Nitrobacter sp. 62-23]